MERSLLIGGFGGQGVMVCGQLLCYAASETTGKSVTFFPSYGAEQRGGAANCCVIISDEEIGSPVVDTPDDLMALSNPSLERFEAQVKPGGTIFTNSSMVARPTRRDVSIVQVPAAEIARAIGSDRVQNLVMVGAYVGYTDLLPLEKVMETAEKKLGKRHPELIPLNNAALRRGVEIGRAQREERQPGQAAGHTSMR